MHPKKLLKPLLLSALKFEKVADNKAGFECNDIKKMSKEEKNSQKHN